MCHPSHSRTSINPSAAIVVERAHVSAMSRPNCNPNPILNPQSKGGAVPMAQVPTPQHPLYTPNCAGTLAMPANNWGQQQQQQQAINPSQHVPMGQAPQIFLSNAPPGSQSFPVQPVHAQPNQIASSSYPGHQLVPNQVHTPQFAIPQISQYPNQTFQNPGNCQPVLQTVPQYPPTNPNTPHPVLQTTPQYYLSNPNCNSLVQTGHPYPLMGPQNPTPVVNSSFVSNSAAICPPHSSNLGVVGQIGQVCQPVGPNNPLPNYSNPFVPSNTPHLLLPCNNLGQQVQFTQPMHPPNPLPNSSTQFIPKTTPCHPSIGPQNPILASNLSPAHNNPGHQGHFYVPMGSHNSVLTPSPSPSNNNLGQQGHLCVPMGPQNPLPLANPQLVPNNIIPCPNYNGPGQVDPSRSIGPWNPPLAANPSPVIHNAPSYVPYTGSGPANQFIRPMGSQNSMPICNHSVATPIPYNNPGQTGFSLPSNYLPAPANPSPSVAYPTGASQFQSNGMPFGINANSFNGQIPVFRPPPPQNINQNVAKMRPATPKMMCSKDALARILSQRRDLPSNKVMKPQLLPNGSVKGRGRFPFRNNLIRGSFNGSKMRSSITTIGNSAVPHNARPRRILRINYTAEEVEQWREDRRKNYPTAANIESKLKDSTLHHSSELSKSRRWQLREILARQAEMGCEVAEIPAHYLYDGGKGEGRRPNQWRAVNKRERRARDETLLKKLLGAEMERDRRLLLQVFGFMVANSFFKDWPDTPLVFPLAAGEASMAAAVRTGDLGCETGG